MSAHTDSAAEHIADLIGDSLFNLGRQPGLENWVEASEVERNTITLTLTTGDNFLITVTRIATLESTRELPTP
jgi:hypothetical protein